MSLSLCSFLITLHPNTESVQRTGSPLTALLPWQCFPTLLLSTEGGVRPQCTGIVGSQAGRAHQISTQKQTLNITETYTCTDSSLSSEGRLMPTSPCLPHRWITEGKDLMIMWSCVSWYECTTHPNATLQRWCAVNWTQICINRH